MRHSVNLKVVGKFPQLEKIFDGFHGHYRYEAWGLYNSRTKIPMKKVAGFEMKYHAKMTDWISYPKI